MKEYIIFSAIALLCFFVVVFYNNAKDILKREGGANRLREYVKVKKNTLAALGFSILGVVLAGFSMKLYEVSFYYALKRLLLLEFLISVAYVDLKKRIIPNKLQLFGVGMFLCFSLYEIFGLHMGLKQLALDSGKGVLLGGGVFLVCMLISGGGMGMGDVKLFSVIGLILGWIGVFNVTFWSVFGIAVYGIVMMCRKKMDKKSMVPMGPFALIGMCITIFMGN